MAAWPSTLPLPLPQSPGYSISPVDQTVRTDMESGAARQRRRTSARNDKLDVSWRLTDAQNGIFRAWFDTDAMGGAAWFTTSLMLGNGGFETVEARFVGGTKMDVQDGTEWLVTAKLEVR